MTSRLDTRIKAMTYAEFTYLPLLRPASSYTLPKGVVWDYVELPRNSSFIRPELPRGNTPHGIIKTDRKLTDDECVQFGLRPV